MNTDPKKENLEKGSLEQAKDKVVETFEKAKDKAAYAADQAQDRTKAQYYETKADVNKNIEQVKDAAKK